MAPDMAGRAGAGRTVDGKMHPRVLELGTQDVVLEIIEADEFAVASADFFLPGCGMPHGPSVGKPEKFLQVHAQGAVGLRA